MTGFNSQAVFGTYRIQFETTNLAYYLAVQKKIQECMDGEASRRCDAYMSYSRRCLGTKEIDCVSCGGDKACCIYPETRVRYEVSE